MLAMKKGLRRQPKVEKASPVRKRTGRFVPPLTVSHTQLLSDGSDNNFRQLIYLFVEVLGRLATCRDAFGRAMELTGSQFAVLIGAAYRQGEDGVTIKQLSLYVHLAPTHVTTEVGRLLRKGLLNKAAGSDDKRSVRVSLTPAGEKAVISVSSFVLRVNDLLFQDVTAADLAAANALFTKLSRNSEFAIAELKVSQRGDKPFE
jgi:DNA-binding MarR family transcriptional regulator